MVGQINWHHSKELIDNRSRIFQCHLVFWLTTFLDDYRNFIVLSTIEILFDLSIIEISFGLWTIKILFDLSIIKILLDVSIIEILLELSIIYSIYRLSKLYSIYRLIKSIIECRDIRILLIIDIASFVWNDRSRKS